MAGIKVGFNDPEEFVGELRQQAGEYAVTPAVVRLTRRYSMAGGGVPYRLLTVVSTFVSNGQLFELTRFCGEVWGIGGESDQKAAGHAKATEEAVEKAAKELALEVRPGVFSFAGKE